ncbi:4259_t:CDS:2, partial [Dentiscutata erythropus]
ALAALWVDIEGVSAEEVSHNNQMKIADFGLSIIYGVSAAPYRWTLKGVSAEEVSHNNQMKIVDFGLSIIYSSNSVNQKYGVPAFIDPQYLQCLLNN